jgi:UDP-glucose 4-epimerase
LTGEQPIINGEGLQTRDYVFVGDVARANQLALEYPGEGIFNIGTGIETDVVRIFELLKSALGSEAPEKHGPPAPGEQERSVLDSSLAAREMNWKPEIDLKEGIRQTADFFRVKFRGEKRIDND